MDVTLDDKLSALQQISQRKLVEILDSISGAKDLIIEQKLMKILDSFIGVTVLRKYGVEKIFKLEQGLKPTNRQRIFFISSDLIVCKRVLDQVQSELSSGLMNERTLHHILVVPYVPVVIRSLLEEEGLSGLVSLYTFSWEFIRTDGNALSLEIPAFADLYYRKNSGFLPSIARALWSLQMVLGSARFVLTLGDHSRKISKIMESMRQCLGSASSMESELGALIVMDRSYDLASALLTPVTYSGLLSEVIDITVGTATLGNMRTKLDPSKDQVYEEARDAPCSDVFPTLHERAKSLKSEQDNIQAMKLEELQHYVATRLQKIRDITRQLGFHISACEAIADAIGSEFQALQATEKSILENKDRRECLSYIEKIIDDRPLRALRLLCLLSITSNGLTANELRPVQKSHLHAHGYREIPLFYKLEAAGLLRRSKADNLLQKLPNWSSEWMVNAHRLKLLPSQSQSRAVESKARSCPSYVFSGAYIPLVAQLLNQVVNQDKDVKSLDDLLNLPGCQVEGQRGAILPKTVVLCVIGGLTYGEIAACRLVEKASGIRLVLASDCLLTGNKVIESIRDS